MVEYAVEAECLVKDYSNIRALDCVSFKVRRGEIFGFIGPNGAGKTTTIKILSTLIQPTSGSAYVLGHDIKREGKKVRERIGVVQQELSWEAWLSVEKNLDFYGYLWGIPKEDRKRRLEFLLDKFGLKDVRKQNPLELSVGQRRRLQVAREFMHSCDLMFLDEPTSGLDPVARRAVLSYLKEKVKEGLTIFFTTHILEEAEYVCDRIAIINRGKILTIGSVEEIKRRFGGFSMIEFAIKDPNLSKLMKIKRNLEEIGETSISYANGKIRVMTREIESALLHVMEIIHKEDARLLFLNVKTPTLDEAFVRAVIGEKKVG